MGIGDVSYYHKSMLPLITQWLSHIANPVVLFVQRKYDIPRNFEDIEGAIGSRIPTVGHTMTKTNQRQPIDIIIPNRQLNI